MTDDTSAIQTAINESQDCSLVVFFPNNADGSRKTYLISDTIDVPTDSVGIEYAEWDSRQATVLRGTTKGTQRPLIKLKSGATGFGSASSPKDMIVIWQKDSGATDYTDNDSDQNFDCAIIGIDFDLNSNSGAVAIEMHAAQGATIQDVTIDATGGYAGIKNFGGLGAAVYNIQITGGQYAIYWNTTGYTDLYPASPAFVGCTFENQTSAVIKQSNKLACPVVFVGCEFANTNTNIPFNDGSVDYGRGGYALIDCIVDFNNTTQAWYVRGSMTAVIWDTYFKGVSTIIDSWAVSDTANWTWVKYYTVDSDWFKNMVDGVVTDATTYSYKEEGKAYDIDDLRYSLKEKHIYDEDIFPSWEDSDIYNVKDAGATGDGSTDDTSAIQTAINNHEKIFFPKGRYLVTSQITLKANTKIVGCDKINTEIKPKSTWQPATTSRTPVVTTEDSSSATTILANIKIGRILRDYNDNNTIDTWTWSDGTAAADQYQFTALEWKAGENSITRNVNLTGSGEWLDPSSHPERQDFAAIIFNGNGGGRHYLLRGAGVPGANEGAMVISGTSNDLFVYPYNFASETDDNVTVSSAQNVRLYYDANEGADPVLKVDGSSDIMLFGMWDNEINVTNVSEFVNDCSNVAFVMGASRNNITSENYVHEEYSGSTYNLTGNNICLFRRGWPSFTTITSRPEENPTKVWITGGSMTGASMQ